MTVLTIILAALALVLATIALLTVRTTRADLTNDLELLTVTTEEDSARTNRLWQELNQTKHRINDDLVAHNHRLNRHRAKLANDYERLNGFSADIRDLRIAEQENRDHLNQLEQDHP